MKTFKKVFSLLTLSICLALCFMMGGCTQTEGQGTYKFSSIKIGNKNSYVELKAGENFMNYSLTEDSVVLVLNEDGSGQLTSEFGDLIGIDTITGSWALISEKQIGVTANDYTLVLDYNGEFVEFEYEDFSIKLKKVKENKLPSFIKNNNGRK
ncbi:MAG: hypothetical protein IKV61_05255 [Clostridia bacterium]|nr:hypothetical protein [Clostridia bacterium]